MSYFDMLRRSMMMLGAHHKTLFLGQSVVYKSNAIFNTLADVPMEKRIELPVIEDFQMGLSIGLALEGYLPISIFPRWDFLLLATNQLVNHLDKMPDAKVIVRTAVGATYPYNSGPQQSGDYSAAFRLMLKHVELVELNSKYDIAKTYCRAITGDKSMVIVERQDLYNE